MSFLDAFLHLFLVLRPFYAGYASFAALVCVMLANNETGTIQPIAEIAAKTRAHGSLLFCDAVQAVGKMPIDIFALGADAMSRAIDVPTYLADVIVATTVLSVLASLVLVRYRLVFKG